MAVRIALVTALVLTSARLGFAQTPAESFADLPQVVKTGTIVYVTDDKGARIKGKISELSPTSLEIMTESNAPARRMTFASDRVTRIARVDSRLNGFLIGLAAGAAPGAWLGAGLYSWCDSETTGGEQCWPVVPIASVPLALIGGWIGFEIDDAINGQTLVFRRSGSPAAGLRVMPIVGARATGVGVSFKF
jgi:hypothetical protein